MAEQFEDKSLDNSAGAAASSPAAHFMQDIQSYDSGAFSASSTSAAVPSLTIDNDSVSSSNSASRNTLAYTGTGTCRWIDDKGNVGYGTCDFDNGTVRPW